VLLTFDEFDSEFNFKTYNKRLIKIQSSFS
jgi:hypothetical protein